MNYYKLTGTGEIPRFLPAGGQLRFLAGGTDLMYRIKKGLLKTDNLTVLDISALKELKGIRREASHLVCGALTTLAEALCSLEKEAGPADLFRQALSLAASPQIRNKATLGGHIAGAYPNSHLLTPLLALGADLEILNKDGKTEIRPLLDVFRLPFHNRLEAGELILSLRLPLEAPRRSLYWGAGDRKAFAFAPFVLTLIEREDGGFRAVGASRRFLPRRFFRIEEALAAGAVGPGELEAVLAAEDGALKEEGGELAAYDKALLTRFIPSFLSDILNQEVLS